MMETYNLFSNHPKLHFHKKKKRKTKKGLKNIKIQGPQDGMLPWDGMHAKLIRLRVRRRKVEFRSVNWNTIHMWLL